MLREPLNGHRSNRPVHGYGCLLQDKITQWPSVKSSEEFSPYSCPETKAQLQMQGGGTVHPINAVQQMPVALSTGFKTYASMVQAPAPSSGASLQDLRCSKPCCPSPEIK